MSISIYALAVDTFVPMLQSLSQILDKGAQHAKEKNLDPAMLPNARLAPDMYPLVKQVQIACDHASTAIAELAGNTPLHLEDNEQTIDELKARIAKTVEYLRSARTAAFEGAENRTITIPIPDNMKFEMTGLEFLRDWALPHFYFHVVTAYDILRHNGVDIGKRDYLSHVAKYIRPRT